MKDEFDYDLHIRVSFDGTCHVTTSDGSTFTFNSLDAAAGFVQTEVAWQRSRQTASKAA